MQKFFRSLLISAIILVCCFALYQTRLNVKAAGVGSITSITGGALMYTATSYTISAVTFDTGLISVSDIISVYISSGSNSGSLGGTYGATGVLTINHTLGQPRTGTIAGITGFYDYTGSTAYLHAFLTDSGGANTGYLMQAIAFISGINRGTIYTNIHDVVLASGISNNLDTVTNSNVTTFTGLYFAKTSGANELGRITFPRALDLTDSGVQTLLSNLGSEDVLEMHEGYIIFSPGAIAAMNSGATITMDFGSGCSFISGVNNPNYFIVYDSSGQELNPNDILSNITSVYANNSGYITFSTSHFTQFSLNPRFTLISITSSNAITGYATSGDTITINFAFDTAADSIADTYIWAGSVRNPITFAGAGKTRSGTYVITAGDQGPITFEIMTAVFFSARGFRTSYGPLPTSDIPTTDGSSVIYNALPITTGGIYTGDVFLSGASATGYISPANGILYVYTTGSLTDNISVDLSGLHITVDTGTWDKTLHGPTASGAANFGETGLPAASTNNGSTTTTRTILLTMQAGGKNGVSLSVSPNFYVEFAVAGGTSGDILKIYRSPDGTTWEANAPSATCTLDANKLCGFFTNHLSYFTVIKETISNNSSNGGGGGGGSYGAFTGEKKSAANNGSGSIVNSPFPIEMNNAYLYAYDIGITSMNTIQKATMTGSLIRAHMAKMMVNYAIKVLGKYADPSLPCNFTDTADQSAEMKNYIKRACQLKLMGQGMTNFYPNKIVTRAEFGTVLSRILYGDKYNGGTPYYLNHLTALKTAAIISNTDPDLQELRGYVMLMLMRAK